MHGHPSTGARNPPAAGRAQPPAGAPVALVPEGDDAGGSNLLRWAIALVALAIVAVGMVGALKGISTL